MKRSWKYAWLVCVVLGWPGTSPAQPKVKLERLGSYRTGVFDGGAAEISAYHARSKRLFVINASTKSVDILSLRDPSNPALVKALDMSQYGDHANSVAVHGNIVAVAVQADPKTDSGSVVFFNPEGDFLNQVTVGPLPDMLTFSPNGRLVFVANEGEPNDDYTIDPEGSVSIINLHKGVKNITDADVKTAGFTQFNNAVLDPSIRIYGPGATVAQDLEPEYIAFGAGGRYPYAYVTLQEANAIGVLDVERAEFVELRGLGFKDHNTLRNALDASDRDNAINIAPWPVFGMYQPDAVAAFAHHGQVYLITANEGDTRDYSAFAEEERVNGITLDPTAFPNAAVLRNNAQLGRLTITTSNGDTDGDGDFDALFVPGARSFTIWLANGVQQVYDSGEEFEQITAQRFPADFNSNNDENGTFDSRSDNKGPEPEGLAVASLYGRRFAFIALERIGGIMIYDITDPAAPFFVDYFNDRDFAGDAEADTAGDLGPEGVLFIPVQDSPLPGVPLLVVSNEVSGSVGIFKILKQE